MFDIVRSPQMQLSQVKAPNLIIMTIGGNNIEFVGVAHSCIYHDERTHDYGPAYNADVNRIGDCAKAIDNSRTKLADKFNVDLADTIKDMLAQPVISDNPDIRIYLTGYVHPFNLAEDWCDNESFGVFPFKPKQYLTHYLRTDVNDLVERLNRQIQQVVAQFSDHHVGYVSITEAFDRHRFCETQTNSHFAQYWNNDVWLWNASSVIRTAEDALSGPDDTGNWLPADLTAPDGTDLEPDGPLFDWSDTNITQGSFLRPFHPKIRGHGAIKDAIVAQLRKDKVPGVTG